MIVTFKRRVAAGFTLIELLIVVIILAILAAIVLPQYASTTGDAREGALDANLSTMRAAIELYKVQHKNKYPGAAASSAGTGCTGTAGTAALNTNQAFVDQLTKASDEAGNTCSVADTTFRFGPYIRGNVPADPITGKGSAVADIVVTSTGAALAPAAATGGWAYDTKSGQLVMNSNDKDAKGALFSTH
jgi:general secretion pathway protein G